MKQFTNYNLLHSFFLGIIFIALTGCSKTQSGIKSYLGSDIPIDSIEHYLDDKMESLKIPGLSIAFINDGEVVYHTTKGYADIENDLPVTSKTIFEGASISKPVFAYFVMTFVEEGKLDLDKPLFHYLEYPDINHDKRYEQITARMVLSHRTGFPNWREDEADGKLKLLFTPNSDYLYSGEGYQYLALVLKTIEKTDWLGLETLFQKKVAQPLGLDYTVFIQTPYTRKHKAQPYDKNAERFDWENDYWFKKSDSVFVAAATIHSESIDFSKWMIALMNKEGLNEASYEELFKPHSVVEQTAFYDLNYTLGFTSLDIPLTNVYMHGGNNQGFTSWFALDTQKMWGYVLFTNSEYGEELGSEMLFYLLTGPDKTRAYLIVSLVIAVILTLLFFLIRWIIRYVRLKLT